MRTDLRRREGSSISTVDAEADADEARSADAPRPLRRLRESDAAQHEAEFNRWYDEVHGPDALANGSFTALHRFRATGPGYRGTPYLALWEAPYDSEAEAWAYIGPRAQALREAGRAGGEVASVRYALMLVAASMRARSGARLGRLPGHAPERLARDGERRRRRGPGGVHSRSRAGKAPGALARHERRGRPGRGPSPRDPGLSRRSATLEDASGSGPERPRLGPSGSPPGCRRSRPTTRSSARPIGADETNDPAIARLADDSGSR
jgi:hypothetical protein